MNIALIAHDEMKDTMIGFCIAYERILKNYGLYGTGTTRSEEHTSELQYSAKYLVCRLLLEKTFFFNDTATTEIYTLSLHDALPILKDTYASMGTPMIRRS